LVFRRVVSNNSSGFYRLDTKYDTQYDLGEIGAYSVGFLAIFYAGAKKLKGILLRIGRITDAV